MTSEELNSRVFSECLGSVFQLQVPGQDPIPLDLIDVSEKDNSPRLEQFSVIFRDPGRRYLPQAIYELDHEKLGRIELFLVPIGPDEEGMCFQACFNRFRKTAPAK